MRTTLAILLVAISANSVEAQPESACAATRGTDLFGPALPNSSTWYGSEALAVQLPVDGVWPTTGPGALIAVKLFWWSAGFRPGMESNLKVTVRRVDGSPGAAVVSRPTNAHVLGDWTMLTGIDFPDAGCWEITGEYLGQRLAFVVETVESSENEDEVDTLVREIRESDQQPPEGPARSLQELLDQVRTREPENAAQQR